MIQLARAFRCLDTFSSGSHSFSRFCSDTHGNLFVLWGNASEGGFEVTNRVLASSLLDTCEHWIANRPLEGDFAHWSKALFDEAEKFICALEEPEGWEPGWWQPLGFLTCLHIREEGVFVRWIGNGVAWLFQEEQLISSIEPHTMARQLREEGVVIEGIEDEEHNVHFMLVRALGGQSEQSSECTQLLFEKEQLYRILLTDAKCLRYLYRNELLMPSAHLESALELYAERLMVQQCYPLPYAHVIGIEFFL